MQGSDVPSPWRPCRSLPCLIKPVLALAVAESCCTAVGVGRGRHCTQQTLSLLSRRLCAVAVACRLHPPSTIHIYPHPPIESAIVLIDKKDPHDLQLTDLHLYYSTWIYIPSRARVSAPSRRRVAAEQNRGECGVDDEDGEHYGAEGRMVVT